MTDKGRLRSCLVLALSLSSWSALSSANAGTWTIFASADQGGVISPSGAVAIAEGSNVMFVISEQTGYDGTNIMVQDGSTNIFDPGSILVGWSNEYSFINVLTNHAIRVLTKPEQRTLVVSQLASLGDPVPNGTNIYDYNQSVTCRISSSETILNTWTSRHYCSFHGTGSTPSGSGTNATFVIRGATTSSVSTLTWNWRLQHWLGSTATGEVGFAQGDGVVDVSSCWWDTNAIVPIHATPFGVGNGQWNFVRWQDDPSTNGCIISSNECLVPMNQPHTNIMAYFEYSPLVGTNWNLIVESEYGQAWPAEGTNSVADGSNIVCYVTNQFISVTDNVERVACRGWDGEGRIPWQGTDTNTPVVKVTVHSKIAWQWKREFFIQTGADSNGCVTLSNGWYVAGSALCITAVACEGYAFNCWTGNVPPENATANPWTFSNDYARVFGASFSTSTIHGTPVAWLQMHSLATTDCNQADLLDPDKDKIPTWQEYVADTDPTNSDSAFRITGIHYDPEGVQIDWKGGEKAWQYLEYRTDLLSTTAQWYCLCTNLPPTPLATNFIHTDATNRQLFYRTRAKR